jgi:hypothetical protein
VARTGSRFIDETGRDRDRIRAFAFQNLLHGYADGLYFNRIVPVAYFADLCAFTIRRDESHAKLLPYHESAYGSAIKELHKDIQGKTIDFRDIIPPHQVLNGLLRIQEAQLHRNVATT